MKYNEKDNTWEVAPRVWSGNIKDLLGFPKGTKGYNKDLDIETITTRRFAKDDVRFYKLHPDLFTPLKEFTDSFKWIEKLTPLKEITDSFKWIEKLVQENKVVENSYLYNAALAEINQKDRIIKSQSLKVEELQTILYNIKKSLNQITAPQKKKHRPTTINHELSRKQIANIHSSTKFIFDSSIEQWQNIFSDQEIKPFQPIQVKHGITLATLRYFWHQLEINELINDRRIFVKLYEKKCFRKGKNIITPRQMTDANKELRNKHKLNKEIPQKKRIDKAIEFILF